MKMQISIKMLSFLISYHIQGLHSVTSGERMANLHGDDENEYLAIYWIIGLACTGWDHSDDNWDILFQQTNIFHLSECSQPVECIVCLKKCSRV